MTELKGTTMFELEGKGPLQLRPSNYVATGGEASIYRAQSTIVKLYTDTGKMRRDRAYTEPKARS